MFLRPASLSLLVLFSGSLAAGQTATGDAQAIAALTQALSAAGGPTALSQVQDFTASGTITYFWAGQQVQGSATVRARGSDQFRLDAVLPEGTRSYAVSHGAGQLKNADGTLLTLPYHNTVNIGVLTFPYLSVSAALSDPLAGVSFIGLTQVNGRQAYEVRVQRSLAGALDPNGTLSSLRITDYFIDAQTGLLLKTSDSTHPDETFTKSYPHEIEFESYAAVSGVQVPMLVREKIDGQTTWQLQLSGVSFNTELTDSVFTLQ